MSRPIVLVDDDADIRASLREALEDEGYTVLEAENGRLALRFLTAINAPIPSAILTDIGMAEMTGLELAQTLKAYSRFADVPIVVMSGLPPSAQTLGDVAAYLEKPVELSTLLETLKALLAH